MSTSVSLKGWHFQRAGKVCYLDQSCKTSKTAVKTLPRICSRPFRRLVCLWQYVLPTTRARCYLLREGQILKTNHWSLIHRLVTHNGRNNVERRANRFERYETSRASSLFQSRTISTAMIDRLVASEDCSEITSTMGEMWKEIIIAISRSHCLAYNIEFVARNLR